jgi:thiamine pyrophosphate-dependent acetolactate synthase large subunit-like protein
MAQTAADVLIETLLDWDVEVVFGLPGDGINGIMEALRTRQDRIRFVQVRQEESAAASACAWRRRVPAASIC